jgi:hypothetical protein
MQANTPSPAPVSPPPDALSEFLRQQRQRSAYILLALSILFLALCAWSVVKAARSTPPPAETETEKKSDDPFALDEGTTAQLKDPARNDYRVAAIAAGACCLVLVGGALWLLASLPPESEAQQRAQARALVLGLGGLIGAVLILAGMAFLYRWSDSLGEWLDKGKTKEAKWVLLPLLMIVVGSGLMFFATFPARAEERNNPLLRRLVYSANFGLTLLLLFVALVVVNIFLGPKLPNKLDTTAESFYSLSTGSKEFLARLDQPVVAYAILPDISHRLYDDIRRLLENCADNSNGQFTYKPISPSGNKNEYLALTKKYPVLEVSDYGVLLVVGADEKRHAFIRDDEFFEGSSFAPRGEQPSRAFVGEARLMKELLFLAESEAKAVVYFTQSAGELNIDPPPGDELKPSATANRLRLFLERSNLAVKPLKFDPVTPKVPDDAAVVVVAEPVSTLAEQHVEAIRQYMTEPRGTKKGKLIVLAGPQFEPGGEVRKTGLEGLLLEFNIRLGAQLLLGVETREGLDILSHVIGFAESARRARNPVALALGEKTAFVTPLWRPVAPVRDCGAAYPAVTLLITEPGRYNWLEDRRPTEFRAAKYFEEFRKDPALLRTKQLTDEARPVGVASSEGESGRVVVIGNGLMVSDLYAQQSRDGVDPITFDLIGATIDWLRDRPPVTFNIEAKKYKSFSLPASADETRGLWFPLLFGLVVVAGLGASVWIVRRRAA